MRPGLNRLKAGRQRLRRDCVQDLRDFFAPWLILPDDFAPGHYKRLFSPARTFWLFLAQIMDDGSCRQANRRHLAWLAAEGGRSASASTAAYCKARRRLPAQEVEKVHADVVRKIQARNGGRHRWRGRRVKVVDGSSVSMPDTPANQQAYPQPAGQKPGCGFPVMRLVALFCLGTGVLIEAATDRLKVNERALFRRLWQCLEKGDVVLADRGFCSYADYVLLKERGVDAVMRKHQRLKQSLKRQKRIAQGDDLMCWSKTRTRPKWLSKEQWDAMPAQITVREITVHAGVPGFRTQTFVLLTSLLDHKAFPAGEFARLYRKRWAVELYLRDIKTTMGMDILSCKSPEMARKELRMHIILYNLTRATMLEAAIRHELPPERISFKGTLDTIATWAPRLVGASKTQSRALVEFMLQHIAKDALPERPDRLEPRVRKRRPKNYPLLTAPRKQYVEIQHRNTYKKTKS